MCKMHTVLVVALLVAGHLRVVITSSCNQAWKLIIICVACLCVTHSVVIGVCLLDCILPVCTCLYGGATFAVDLQVPQAPDRIQAECGHS